MAASLAKFQATKPTARSSRIDDVLEAMAGAFELGFAYTYKAASEGLAVTVHHASGWDMETIASGVDCLGLVLTGLLGIRIDGSAQAAQLQQAASPEVSEDLEALIQEADGHAAALAEVMAEEEPEAIERPEPQLPPEKVVPLSDSDRTTCLAMLKALEPDQRREFTIQFRDHFKVPRESRTISPFVTQQQHKDFIQAFVDELELQAMGVAV